LPFGVDPTKELLTLPCQFTLPFALQPTPVTRVNFYAPGRTPVKVLSRPFPSVLVFLSHVQPCVVSNQVLIFLIGSKVYTERFLSAPFQEGLFNVPATFGTLLRHLLTYMSLAGAYRSLNVSPLRSGPQALAPLWHRFRPCIVSTTDTYATWMVFFVLHNISVV